MSRFGLGFAGLLLLIGLFLVSSSFFIVNQGEQALVLRFGAVADPDHPIKGPGLHTKKPLVEDVVRYDARLLDLFSQWAGEAAFKRILVDNPVELYGFSRGVQ